MWAQPGGAAIRLGQVGTCARPTHPPALARLTCNNLPDLVGGHHACGGVHVATAAPWPVSAARQTGHA